MVPSRHRLTYVHDALGFSGSGPGPQMVVTTPHELPSRYGVPFVRAVPGPDGAPGVAWWWDALPEPPPGWRGAHAHSVPVTAPALPRFVRLALLRDDDLTLPARVATLAEEFGPLGLCRHGLPYRHRVVSTSVGRPGDLVEDGAGCAPGSVLPGVAAGTGPPARWEPAAGWLRLARHLAGLLSVAVELVQDGPGRTSDYHAVLALWPAGDRRPLLPEVPDPAAAARAAAAATLATQRFLVAQCVEWWLRVGGVDFAYMWAAGMERPVYLPFVPDLTGLLAVQLAGAVQGTLARCAGCGLPFGPPGRKPPAGRRAWCPACGRRAQWRDYQRRRRRSPCTAPPPPAGTGKGEKGEENP